MINQWRRCGFFLPRLAISRILGAERCGISENSHVKFRFPIADTGFTVWIRWASVAAAAAAAALWLRAHVSAYADYGMCD